MKKIALKSEASVSACSCQIYSLLVLNIFGFKCGRNISNFLNASDNDKIEAYGWIKCWYIFGMCYFIIVLAIQASVLTVVLGGDALGLIGMIIPLTVITLAGIQYLFSAYDCFKQLCKEWELKKQISTSKEFQFEVVNPQIVPTPVVANAKRS